MYSADGFANLADCVGDLYFAKEASATVYQF